MTSFNDVVKIDAGFSLVGEPMNRSALVANALRNNNKPYSLSIRSGGVSSV